MPHYLNMNFSSNYCREEHAMGVYGLRQILSRTTTIAMTVAASTPGRTTRLNTSSPSDTGLNVATVAGEVGPAFFLDIRAASWPSLPVILQLLLEKLPSILKLGGGGDRQPRLPDDDDSGEEGDDDDM